MGSARQKYSVKILSVFCYEQLADVTFSINTNEHLRKALPRCFGFSSNISLAMFLQTL